MTDAQRKASYVGLTKDRAMPTGEPLAIDDYRQQIAAAVPRWVAERDREIAAKNVIIRERNEQLAGRDDNIAMLETDAAVAAITEGTHE